MLDSLLSFGVFHEWRIMDKFILLVVFYCLMRRTHFHLVLMHMCMKFFLQSKKCFPSLYLFFDVDSLRGSNHSLPFHLFLNHVLFLPSLTTASSFLVEIGIRESGYSWWTIKTLEICYGFIVLHLIGFLKNT